MPRFLSVALALLVATASANQGLAQTPRTAPAPAAQATFKIEGFRSARFGMTPAQAREAAMKDFGVPASAITETGNAREQTTALVVAVPKLEPGPGPAVVTYIFGASKKTLMHINVAWTLPQPTAEQRQALATGAVQLASYFQGLTWPAGRTTGGVLSGAGTVVVFGGMDAAGAGVEVVAVGIPFESVDPKAAKPAPPTGAAQLLVSYAADIQKPDVVRLAPGSF